MYAIAETENLLLHGDHAYLPASRAWRQLPSPPPAKPIDARAALLWLQTRSGHGLRVPIGVVGPREDDAERDAIAEAVGDLLGACRLPLLCGGGAGVMAAASRGAAKAGGLAIGLLPGREPEAANPYVSLVLASGIGEARNAIIATASHCLIVVGDSFGTLSEVAFARRLDKTVFAMPGAADVAGLIRIENGIADLASRLAECLLGKPQG